MILGTCTYLDYLLSKPQLPQIQSLPLCWEACEAQQANRVQIPGSSEGHKKFDYMARPFINEIQKVFEEDHSFEAHNTVLFLMSLIQDTGQMV